MAMEETVQTTTTAPAPAKGRSIRWGTILIWVAVVAVLAVLGWGLMNANATRPEPGAEAPAFEVQFFDGYEWQGADRASLEDMRGQVVVLNFWASWCVECRVEADLLENTWKQYKDDGVVFLGVAYVDSEPKSLAYLEEFNVTYPNGPDLRSTISDRYEVTGVPETFFIGKDGKVAHVQIGPVNSSVMNAQINKLLAQ